MGITLRARVVSELHRMDGIVVDFFVNASILERKCNLFSKCTYASRPKYTRSGTCTPETCIFGATMILAQEELTAINFIEARCPLCVFSFC